MRITVLSDNSPSNNLQCEHGLSVYVELDQNKFILDTGASNIFSKNAHKLGIDLSQLDFCVLSHGHWDHANGLPFLKEGTKIIAHPHIFKKRYRLNSSYIGISLNKEVATQQFDFEFIDDSKQIEENVFFLTNIMRTKVDNNFLLENGDFDLLEDDSSIVIKTKKGLVLLSGCAHAGIKNHIVEACRITGERSIYAIIGGLHIKTAEEANEIGPFLNTYVTGTVYTGHCTSRGALMALAAYVPVENIYSGFEFKA